jgi:hypothetical protein
VNRRDFLAGLSALCAVTASGLQLNAAAGMPITNALAKSAKVRHVSAYRVESHDWVHRFDILIGPDDRITKQTQQFGVDIRSDNKIPTASEIEPALQLLANHVERVTGGKYEFTAGPMLSVSNNADMAEYRV